MSEIRLYLDEDAMSNSLLRALRSQKIDVIAAFRRVRTLKSLLSKGFSHFIGPHQRRHRYISVQEAGTEGSSDDQQLNWAATQGRVIYSHNIGDFYQLHSEYLQSERNHASIALIPQNTTIGDQARAVVALVSQRTLENMKNECIFLKQFL
jgi:hypothetical protein